MRFADHIDQNGDAEAGGGLADFAPRQPICPMHFYTPKMPAQNRFLDHRGDASGITFGMDEGEARQFVGMAGDNARDLSIGGSIVGMKRREDDGAADPSLTRPFEML